MSGLLCMPVEASYHGCQPFASMPSRPPNALKRTQEIITRIEEKEKVPQPVCRQYSSPTRIDRAALPF